MSEQPISWKDKVDPKDLAAAEDYLSIRFSPEQVAGALRSLRAAKLTRRRADDILRACGHQPLPLSDPRVQRQQAKLAAGKQLKPVLVVQLPGAGADIAQGEHRLSLAYHQDPATLVPVAIGRTEGGRE